MVLIICIYLKIHLSWEDLWTLYEKPPLTLLSQLCARAVLVFLSAAVKFVLWRPPSPCWTSGVIFPAVCHAEQSR